MPWWAVPLIILLVPIVLVALLGWALYSLGLYLLIWCLWATRGKDVLFVYSDSPHWKEYIEHEILPRIEGRAVILNWSGRRKWVGRWGLGPMTFRHFGGYREYNPMALHFPLFGFHRAYRFWEPLRKWRKKDNRNELDVLLARFFADLGVSSPELKAEGKAE